MNFSDQPPSKQWAALKFRGEKLAEVWFKPEGEPLAVLFRIPQGSFQIPGVGQRLTIESLLKAVGIAPDEVESCRQGGDSDSAPDEADLQLDAPLGQPAPDVHHLEVLVRLKPPHAVSRDESAESGAVPAKWQEVEARWHAVLALEANIDSQRISMEALRAEMESSFRRTLNSDEKMNALSSDVAQWNKAKSRIHYALPKAREFIHRATWAEGNPERKKLGEFFKDADGAVVTLPVMDKVLDELEILRKDRQVLSNQGVTVSQDCKGILADVQAALSRLQSNAATRATKKKGSAPGKRKPF